MTSTADELRAEIGDLESYLAGLPDELREGPYGAVYRSRLELLRDELATAELLQTAQ
jgi:hypothetical protein